MHFSDCLDCLSFISFVILSQIVVIPSAGKQHLRHINHNKPMHIKNILKLAYLRR